MTARMKMTAAGMTTAMKMNQGTRDANGMPSGGFSVPGVGVAEGEGEKVAVGVEVGVQVGVGVCFGVGTEVGGYTGLWVGVGVVWESGIGVEGADMSKLRAI